MFESNPPGRHNKAICECTGPSPTTHPPFKVPSFHVPANLCLQTDALPLRLRLVRAPLRGGDSFKAALSILPRVALGARARDPSVGDGLQLPGGRVPVFELRQTHRSRAEHPLHVPSPRVGSALASAERGPTAGVESESAETSPSGPPLLPTHYCFKDQWPALAGVLSGWCVSLGTNESRA